MKEHYDTLAKGDYSSFGRLNGLPATDADKARLQSFFSRRSKYYRNISSKFSKASSFIKNNAKKLGFVIAAGIAGYEEWMIQREISELREQFPELKIGRYRYSYCFR